MSTIQRKCCFCLLLLAGALAAVGCAHPPVPANPDQARDALRRALDAWQRGETAESLQDQQPPLRVFDEDWRGGRQLVRYQLDTDQLVGADLRCRVQLWLRDGSGQSVQKKAVYSVATSPALTVVHEEDS
jgi:hypothetical protein